MRFAHTFLIPAAFIAQSIAATQLYAAPKSKSAGEAGVLRVNATVQEFSSLKPWIKRAPVTLRGIGAVLSPNRVLISAMQVANRTYVELERAEDGAKCSATVEVIDYFANLALLRPDKEGFLAPIQPVRLAEPAKIDDLLDVIQLEPGGTLVSSPGRVTGYEVGSYRVPTSAFLLCRITLPLQYREGSFSLPVFDEKGALAGLSLRYDNRSQTMDLIPPAIIAHFLKDAEEGAYEGFPRVGLSFDSLRDPMLRRHTGAPSGDRGVFVSSVLPRSPALEAGIKPGDVLLKAGAFEIDADGNFNHPNYGELAIAHIFSTEHQSGEKLPITLLRDGKELVLDVRVLPRQAEDWAIPPFRFDNPPPYLIVGGLVFVELGRFYLNEWGSASEREAPIDLLYLDRFQDDLIPAGQRIVLLSHVLPTPDTVGYEGLQQLRLLRCNGMDIGNLSDLASALDKPVDGFHRFETDGDPRSVVLDASRIEAIATEVARRYRIPEMRRLP